MGEVLGEPALDGSGAVGTVGRPSLAGTTFWFLWLNAVSLQLIVSADRFTFLWLVEDTLGSPTWASGLIVFAIGAPVCLLVMTAGALADRHDRRRMLMTTQVAGLGVVTVGAALVWTEVIDLGIAVVLAAAFGTVVAFALPVRSSLVPALVGPGRVMQAVVWMTVGSNVAMIAGPLFVGGIIEAHGVAWAFVAQGACFTLGLGFATRIVVPPRGTVVARRSLRADIGQALRFVRDHDRLGPLFLLLGVGGGVMGGSAFTLLPRIARDEFDRGAAEAGRMFALMGLGMIITSLTLMRHRARLRRRGLTFIGFMILGTVNQMLQGVAPSFLALQGLLLLWGLTGGFYINLNQSLIQELTPADRMGRVMALNALVGAGLLPLGGLAAGVVASLIGPRETLSLFGVVSLGCVLVVLWRAEALRNLR